MRRAGPCIFFAPTPAGVSIRHGLWFDAGDLAKGLHRAVADAVRRYGPVICAQRRHPAVPGWAWKRHLRRASLPGIDRREAQGLQTTLRDYLGWPDRQHPCHPRWLENSAPTAAGVAPRRAGVSRAGTEGRVGGFSTRNDTGRGTPARRGRSAPTNGRFHTQPTKAVARRQPQFRRVTPGTQPASVQERIDDSNATDGCAVLHVFAQNLLAAAGDGGLHDQGVVERQAVQQVQVQERGRQKSRPAPT